MRIVSQGPEAWCGTFSCPRCETQFEADQNDLQTDGFKADPNTYWYDGSATSIQKFFVECPMDRHIIIVPDDDIPALVRDAVTKAKID